MLCGRLTFAIDTVGACGDVHGEDGVCESDGDEELPVSPESPTSVDAACAAGWLDTT